jgi:hypothetical protein
MKFNTNMHHSILHKFAKYHSYSLKTLASKPSTVIPLYTREMILGIYLSVECLHSASFVKYHQRLIKICINKHHSILHKCIKYQYNRSKTLASK